MLEQLPNREWVDLLEIASVQVDEKSETAFDVVITTKQGVQHVVPYPHVLAAQAYETCIGLKAKAAQDEERGYLSRFSPDLGDLTKRAGQTAEQARAQVGEAVDTAARHVMGVFERMRGKGGGQ